jgi:hypothetical protein
MSVLWVKIFNITLNYMNYLYMYINLYHYPVYIKSGKSTVRVEFWTLIQCRVKCFMALLSPLLSTFKYQLPNRKYASLTILLTIPKIGNHSSIYQNTSGVKSFVLVQLPLEFVERLYHLIISNVLTLERSILIGLNIFKNLLHFVMNKKKNNL